MSGSINCCYLFLICLILITTVYTCKLCFLGIVCTPKDIIKHTYIDVKMQQGCDDGGLFAIAFATLLARGEQPGSFLYEQKAMRKQLIESLEKQILLHSQYKR